MGKSVQFYSKKDVLDAYTDAGIAAWACVCEKDMPCRYEGEDIDEGLRLLDEWLTKIETSAAIYTLRLYSEPADRITLRSEYDLSFNFRLRHDERFSGAAYPGNSEYMKREIDQLRERISELENADQSEPEPIKESVGTVILRNLEPVIPRLAEGLLNMLSRYMPVPQSPQLGNITYTTQPGGMQTTEDQLIKLAQLIPHPDNVQTVLAKLIKLAEEKPEMFRAYLAML